MLNCCYACLVSYFKVALFPKYFGCIFVSDDLLSKTLVSYTGLVFPYIHHDDVIIFLGKCYFWQFIVCMEKSSNHLFASEGWWWWFLKKKINHPSNSHFARSCFTDLVFLNKKVNSYIHMFLNSIFYFIKRPISGKQK